MTFRFNQYGAKQRIKLGCIVAMLHPLLRYSHLSCNLHIQGDGDAVSCTYLICVTLQCDKNNKSLYAFCHNKSIVIFITLLRLPQLLSVICRENNGPH